MKSLNPKHTRPKGAGFWACMTVLVATSPIGAAPPSRDQEVRGAGICARVRIQLEQEAVITRTAFKVTLEITNESTTPGDTVDQVHVVLEILDADGNLANSRFGIPAPTLENLSDINGSGTIAPNTTAKAQWLILPTDEAAPTPNPSRYSFGGEFSYFKSGHQVTVPLYPVPIDVLPDAKLFLKYFLQSPVYSDNPFTLNKVEPAEPFSLGLLVTNAGLGDARNLRITSAEPRIIENQRDLLIAFQLLGTQVGTQPVSPSFTVNFGNIPPGASAVARWKLTASLQGRFIDYDASFEHVSGLGDPRLSLIQNVDIFELSHIVLLDDDPLPDFLVNNPPAAQSDDLPDEIHSSRGTVLPLTVITDAQVDSRVNRMDLSIQLTATVQPGWNYVRVPDPGEGSYRLVQVTNMTEGGNLLTGGTGDVCNAWTTHRFLPIDGPPTGREDRLHLLVKGQTTGPVTFQVDYVPLLRLDQFRVNQGLAQRSNDTMIEIIFNNETRIPALIQNGQIAQAVTLWQRGTGGGADVQVPLEAARYSYDPTTYRLLLDLTTDGPGGGNLTLLTDGNYELRVDTNRVTSVLETFLPDEDGLADGVFRFGDDATDKLFRLAGDTNTDRGVNYVDLQTVRNSWLKSSGDPGFNPNADLNGDSTVNETDMAILQGNWLNFLPF